MFDLPHAAQRLRRGGQSPAAGLPLYGFEFGAGDANLVKNRVSSTARSS